jgi:hypothetical protein
LRHAAAGLPRQGSEDLRSCGTLSRLRVIFARYTYFVAGRLQISSGAAALTRFFVGKVGEPAGISQGIIMRPIHSKRALLSCTAIESSIFQKNRCILWEKWTSSNTLTIPGSLFAFFWVKYSHFSVKYFHLSLKYSYSSPKRPFGMLKSGPVIGDDKTPEGKVDGRALVRRALSAG